MRCCAIQDARGQIRSVTLRRNPLVPIVVRISGILQLYLLQPGILTWGLIEMRVDTEVSHEELRFETL